MNDDVEWLRQLATKRLSDAKVSTADRPWRGYEIERLMPEIVSVLADAVTNDNGFDACRFCLGRGYPGEPLPHEDACPVAALDAALRAERGLPVPTPR